MGILIILERPKPIVLEAASELSFYELSTPTVTPSVVQSRIVVDEMATPEEISTVESIEPEVDDVDDDSNEPANSFPPSPSLNIGGDLVLVSRVIDGDTIELASGDRVRYIGIDTPETVDPRELPGCFGHEAAAQNQELVENQLVRLEKDITDRDKYGRLLRYVYLADGTFVNLSLVEEGFAFNYTYPPDLKHQLEFFEAEQEARAAKAGLWGSCGAKKPPTSTCVIKGNINSAGDKIYHLPGQRYYNKTAIDEGKGERWFCTEEEAETAGWRPSKI